MAAATGATKGFENTFFAMSQVNQTVSVEKAILIQTRRVLLPVPAIPFAIAMISG
jgi:hypothetical protein